MGRRSKELTEKFEVNFDSFLAVQGFFIILFVFQLWIAVFYQQSIFSSKKGWQPNDAEIGAFPSHIGVHYFSDYSAMVAAAQRTNPWALSNNYPPFAMLIFKIFGVFPSQLGLIAWLVFSALAMLLPLWAVRRSSLSNSQRILLILAVCLSAPYIATLDRGNVIAILPLLITIFYLSYQKNKFCVAGVFLGIAISIKIYPIIILVYLYKRRSWKVISWSIIYFLLLTFVSTLFFNNSSQNFFLSFHGILLHNNIAKESQPMIFSAVGIIHNFLIAIFGESSQIAVWCLNNATVLSLFLFVCIGIISPRRYSLFAFLPYLYSFQLIPLQSYTYTRIWVFIAIPLLIRAPRSSLKKIWFAIVGLNLAPFTVWVNNINLLPSAAFLLFFALLLLQMWEQVGRKYLLRERMYKLQKG